MQGDSNNPNTETNFYVYENDKWITNLSLLQKYIVINFFFVRIYILFKFLEKETVNIFF